MRAWEEFLQLQEKKLGTNTVNKWLRSLKLVRFDACNLYLEANDSFQVIWFEEHIRPILSHSLSSKKNIKVHLSLADKKEKPHPQKNEFSNSSGSPKSLSDAIDPHSTFDNFLSCPENLLANKVLYETTQTTTLSPLTFNPIYLYGYPGSGKTHLLMATANRLKKAGRNVIYVRARTFTEHVVHAIRSGEMQSFRKKYRTVDTLLIDDIQILSKKIATQEELFHTFNPLHIEGKQIILSSNASPQDLKDIESRLVSRFEWGIVIPLQMPSKEHMKKILLQKAQSLHFPLEEEIIHFFLETFSSNTKVLIRSFEALVLRKHLNLEGSPSPLSVPLVKQLLADLIQEEEQKTLTSKKIIRTVAEFYGIKIEDILSKSQSHEYVLPRKIAMHLCRKQLHLPYVKIGDIFTRDHSTVMTSIKQIQKKLTMSDAKISNSIKGILKLLNISKTCSSN